MEESIIFIPYLPSGAQGNELRYAIAGWRRHCKSPYHIAIVGGHLDDLRRDEWINREDVTTIESKRVGCIPGMYRPHLDYVKCMKAVHETFPKSKGIVFASDDCYAVNDFTVDDILVPKCIGKDFTGNQNRMGWPYDQWRTRRLLEKEGLPHINYTTHIPQWFDWDKLEEIWERYHMEHESYVVENIYHNCFVPDIEPVLLDNYSDRYRFGVWNKNIPYSTFEEMAKSRIWLVNSVDGWSQSFDRFLREYYKEDLK